MPFVISEQSNYWGDKIVFAACICSADNCYAATERMKRESASINHLQQISKRDYEKHDRSKKVYYFSFWPPLIRSKIIALEKKHFDLRHYKASIILELGVLAKYAMQTLALLLKKCISEHNEE